MLDDLLIFLKTCCRYHVAVSTGSEETCQEALSVMSVWCMAQHFAVRTYAQVFVQKLLEFCDIKGFASLVLQFGQIGRCVADSIAYQGSNMKNAEKLRQDFYLTVFEPMEAFNLGTIFCDFTRTCNLPLQEQMPHWLFRGTCVVNRPGRSKLSSCHKGDAGKCWCPRCHMSTGTLEDKLETLDGATGDVIQKKVMPWTAMLDEDDGEATGDTPKAHPGLVVVASLIDKLPNLGGLCRTCEILGVGLYVVPCEKSVKEPEFQSVSVTAHQWTPIREVRPTDLVSYLRQQRDQG